MMEMPFFMTNEEWFTSEGVVTEDGDEVTIYHLTDKAPEAARKSLDEWNEAVKAAKEGGYDF